MFRPRVIPCLLLQGLGLVKTIGFKKPTYIGDPINAVKIFNELDADELIFLDISASRERRIPSLELIQSIGDEAFMPFAVGGGIVSFDQIREIIMRGAEKVVLCSTVFDQPNLVTEGARVYGSQCIVVAIDVKRDLFGRYRVCSHGGTIKQSVDPVAHARRMEELGAGELLVNCIDRDGTMKGYDIELTRMIADAVQIPVIACGGAGNLDHLVDAVRHGRASAAAAGSIFVYHGEQRGVLINYPRSGTLRDIFAQ